MHDGHRHPIGVLTPHCLTNTVVFNFKSISNHRLRKYSKCRSPDPARYSVWAATYSRPFGTFAILRVAYRVSHGAGTAMHMTRSTYKGWVQTLPSLVSPINVRI